MKLEQFFKRIKPKNKRSKFEPYREDILQLREQGYSYPQIVEYLKSNGVKCNHSEIIKFLNRKQGCKQNVQKMNTPTPKRAEIKRQENSSTKSAEIPNGYHPRVPFKEGDKWFMYLEDGEKRRCTSTGVSHNPDPSAAKDLY